MNMPFLSRVMVSFVIRIAVSFLFFFSFIHVANGLLNAQESSLSALAQASQPQNKQPEARQSDAPQEQQSKDQQSEEQQSQDQQAPASGYDKGIFQAPIPANRLAFLTQFEGKSSDKLIRDKEFRKLLRDIIPNCMFHYGHDMPLTEAIDTVIKGSSEPVRIRDGRYLLISGHMGPYLLGRGFLWIDLQDGIGLGGFYFHPTNGEPTPAVNIFSQQISDEPLRLSELPPAFAEDLRQWSADSRVPQVTTRYFITATNRKVLLEHDEDYCSSSGLSTDRCQEVNADAADLDLNAAYYLEQTNYATNSTAWMITGQEQVAWLRVRDNTCQTGINPLLCRIRITHERVHIIVRRHAPFHPPVRVTRR